MRSDIASLFRERRGHFEFESRHHGDVWLDLESLCSRPRAVRPLAAELARLLRRHSPEVICGPLVEGAFVALLTAEELGLEFSYAVPEASAEATALFPMHYKIPLALRSLEGRRVAIANDVINAGSAVRGTLADLKLCGANVVAIGTLLSLGNAGEILAADSAIPYESLESQPNNLWRRQECPLCAANVPLSQNYNS